MCKFHDHVIKFCNGRLPTVSLPPQHVAGGLMATGIPLKIQPIKYENSA